MTKKHFIELADVIRAAHPRSLITPFSMVPTHYSAMVQGWEAARDALADFCARQNPHFNRERWLAYIAGECGPGGGKNPAQVPPCLQAMGCLCAGHARSLKARECDTREGRTV